jgi:hypothetical protein
LDPSSPGDVHECTQASAAAHARKSVAAAVRVIQGACLVGTLLATGISMKLHPKLLGGRSWVLVHETAVEAHRGLSLKVSPQFQTAGDLPGSTALRRLSLAADLLPRTHWNVNVSCYHDHTSGSSTSTLLAQLHLYL